VSYIGRWAFDIKYLSECYKANIEGVATMKRTESKATANIAGSVAGTLLEATGLEVGS
jgi:hypothetical protein